MKILRQLKDFSYPYPSPSNIIQVLEASIPAVQFFTEHFNQQLKQQNINVFCRGSSGLILATLLCNKFFELNTQFNFGINYKICYIRKEKESSHAIHEKINFRIYEKPINIFIDDFISHGDTFRNVLEKATQSYGGDFLYDYVFLMQNITNKDTYKLIESHIKEDGYLYAYFNNDFLNIVNPSFGTMIDVVGSIINE